jgi:hypothetical protein
MGSTLNGSVDASLGDDGHAHIEVWEDGELMCEYTIDPDQVERLRLGLTTSPSGLLAFGTTPAVIEKLDLLVAGGMHGATREAVAEELMRAGLRAALNWNGCGR